MEKRGKREWFLNRKKRFFIVKNGYKKWIYKRQFIIINKIERKNRFCFQFVTYKKGIYTLGIHTRKGIKRGIMIVEF